MKTRKIYASLIVALLSLGALSACSDSPETYTADYLYENDDIRQQVLDDCKANKQSDENCKNANEAQNKKSMEDYANKAFK